MSIRLSSQKETENVTKKMISDCFANLRKWDYLVFNFNNNRKITYGKIQGWTDLVIIGKGCIYFIEVKIRKDKMRDEQNELQTKILEVAFLCAPVFYWIATEKNYKDLYEIILTEQYSQITLNK